MANHQKAMCETKHHDARVADLPEKEWVSLYTTLIVCSSVTKDNEVGRHNPESHHEQPESPRIAPTFVVKEVGSSPGCLLSDVCCLLSRKCEGGCF